MSEWATRQKDALANKLRADDRKNAAKHAAVGVGLVSAGSVGDRYLEGRLKRKGLQPPVKATFRGKLRPGHVPHLAGKAGTRALAGVGLPMAAYGGWQTIRPTHRVKDVDLRRDVVDSTLEQATFRAQASEFKGKRPSSAVEKYLAPKEKEQLGDRKRLGREISLAGGTMGLAALGLRSPEITRLATKKIPKLRNSKRIGRFVAKEPSATKASNLLGVAAIGTGAAGSFNYAAQQKLETKAIETKKSLSPEKRAQAKARAKRNGRRYPNAYDNMISGGAKFEMKKSLVELSKAARGTVRKDRFLDKYRDRISPQAESGYRYLRDGRNQAIGTTAVAGATTALSTHEGLAAMKRGSKARPLAALHGAIAVGSAATAASQAKKAKDWNEKLGKIKAKAKERARTGEYGRDRVGKRDSVGLAEIAAGGGLIAAGASSERIADKVYNRAVGRVDAQRDRRLAAIGTPRQNEKGKKAQLQRVQRAHKKSMASLEGFTTGAPRKYGKYVLPTLGAGLAWQGARRQVEKAYDPAKDQYRTYRDKTGVERKTASVYFKDPSGQMKRAVFGSQEARNRWLMSRSGVQKSDKRRVDAAAAGAAGSAALYHAAAYATKPLDARDIRRTAADEVMVARVREHRKQVGMPRMDQNARRKNLTYYRTYPKGLPGSARKRLLSRTHSGKSGALATLLVAGGGAAAGDRLAKADDDRKKVAAGVAAGAVGTAAFPTLQRMPRDNGSSKRIASQLKGDVSDVDIKDVRGVASGSGFRFKDSQHVARLATRINDEGFDRSRPIEVTRHRDGSMRVTGGHHRLEASERLGQSKVPVRVREGGSTPRQVVPLARVGRWMRDVAGARKPRGRQSIEQIRAEAAKPIPAWANRLNSIKAKAEDVAVKVKPKYAAGAVAVAGAGVGAKALRDRKVEKAFLLPKVPRTPGLPRPIIRKPRLGTPTVRQGYVARNRFGTSYTVRGTTR